MSHSDRLLHARWWRSLARLEGSADPGLRRVRGGHRAVVALGLATVPLAGCSRGSSSSNGRTVSRSADDAARTSARAAAPGEPGTTSAASQGDAAEVTASAASPGTTDPEPTDAAKDELLSLSDEQGARGDLRKFRGAADDGVWSAAGEVQNPTGDDQVYYVRIGIIEGDESRSSVAFKNVVIDVDANGSEEFAAEDIVTTQQKDLDCLPRVVRGDGQQ